MIRRDFPETWHYKSSDRWISGIPDIIGCMDGLFFAMELKTEKGKVAPIQKYVMKKMEASGAKVRVIRSVQDAQRFLLEIKMKGGVQNGN